METAAAEVVSQMQPRVMGETGEMEDAVVQPVQVLLKSAEDPLAMRSLNVSGMAHCRLMHSNRLGALGHTAIKMVSTRSWYSCC